MFVDGQRRPADEALAGRGVAPYELLLKDGLALINGAPLAAGGLGGAGRVSPAASCSSTRRRSSGP